MAFLRLLFSTDVLVRGFVEFVVADFVAAVDDVDVDVGRGLVVLEVLLVLK